MLKRYCELVEELGSMEQVAIADLSTEEIVRYLDLRRQQEELAGQLLDILTDALLQLQDLADKIGDELMVLPEVIENVRERNAFNELPMGQLAYMMGALQSDMERILADCRQIHYEFLWGDQGGQKYDHQLPQAVKSPADTGKDGEKTNGSDVEAALALEEVACAREGVVIDMEMSAGTPEQAGGEKYDGVENKEDGSVLIKPETLKKLEDAMRPRELAGAVPAMDEKENSFAVIKVAPAGKDKARIKHHKERHRR
ncbi:hypothetical protein GFC01_08660 [Desulfofundulus thermobenzoicus]|uniref:Uncharacterized protein n=1 Tax=Desulfofundulus thermobenzoicus TaxID=29376 RepID=A0A6N7IQP3_9FIRM|nr:hypothetical protein [Desulfofundulus thermobenzoicus]MQL52340.1 hypothetical protein [Desulfofundulus thermobenzoicus]HHW42255.1 hypothetical protein [Desulfotomaculum sp.]